MSGRQTTQILPVSAVVPTRDRAAVLARTLHSLIGQSAVPAELIVIDASADVGMQAPMAQLNVDAAARGCRIITQRADIAGAAAQRNQGVRLASNDAILFIDDDVRFEPECLSRLWSVLRSDKDLGGVNATITNQSYQEPGRATRMMLRVMAGAPQSSYAGRVVGPAINLLPADDDALPDVVAVDWLNLGCTLYRRAALPDPVFDAQFSGYSLMEDLALSLTVSRRWKLANVRAARIFHDSQPGAHKSDCVALNRMELVNRHFVMTEILGRRSAADHAKLALWQVFQLCACAAGKQDATPFWRTLRGKWLGLADIARARAAGAKP